MNKQIFRPDPDSPRIATHKAMTNAMLYADMTKVSVQKARFLENNQLRFEAETRILETLEVVRLELRRLTQS